MNRPGLSSVGRWSCLGGACLGALGLLGWVAHLPALTTLLPGQPAMMANTGLGLLLLGIAGVLVDLGPGRLQQGAAISGTLTALAIGLGTLAQYALGIDLQLDQLLVPSTGSLYPGRPSPPTALAFILLASALLVRPKPPRTLRAGEVPRAVAPAGGWQRARARLSEGLSLSAALIAFTALLGQLFGAGEFYLSARTPVIGVAVPTAIGLLLVSGGLLLERPAAGVVRVASAAGPGGMLVRRLGPYVILAPTLIGVLVLRFFTALGLDEVRLAVASVAGVTTVGGLLLLILTAKPLERVHHALAMTRARTRELFEQAPEGVFVADLNGRYTDANGAGCRMLGYSREELVGMTILDVIAPEDTERLWQSKAQMLEGQAHVAEWTLRRKDGSQFPAEVSAKILADGRWQGFVRDISERRLALEQIRQARERFELALWGADLAAWDWNIVTGEVIFNSRWAEMRGLRPEDVRPHEESWSRGVHPEDWPRVQQALAEHFQGITPEYQIEHRVLTKSGEWIWILHRGKVFARAPGGQPTRMVGTELDITERKRLEEVLRFSEAKFSGMVSISADAIISVDDEQRITLFNEGAEKLFGYSQAEAIGAPLDRLIPERFRAHHREELRRFASGADTARRLEGGSAGIVGLRKSGAEFPAAATISRLDLGEARILTVALHDISEQRRVESEQTFLAEVGKVLSSTLDYEETLTNVARLAVLHVSDVCMVDIVGEDGRMRRLKVASRDPSKIWACDLLTRVPIDRTRPHLARESLETRRSVLFEHFSPELLDSLAQSADHLRALRGIEPESAAVVPLISGGRLLGVIALVSSAPSRRYGPAELRLAEELAHRAALSIENARLYRAARQAVQARDDVLGIVAHDLRNPLGSILMQAELLRRRVLEPQGLPSKPADVIERAAARMNHLIQDLLDVSRMEAGQLSIEQNRFPAAQVASDALEAQRPLASSASVQLRLDLEPQLPEVWADRDRLLQVFENLLGNALRFTSAGGQVTIGAKARGRTVLFRVSDTGAGIAPEHVPHLFDRFWQAQKTGRRGAGLGLPIVKGIIEAHGGRVWVDSSPGSGSSFCFTIPTAPRLEEPRQPASAPHGP